MTESPVFVKRKPHSSER